MRMQDGSATTTGERSRETGEKSREPGENEDDDSVSLRMRLPDGRVSIKLRYFMVYCIKNVERIFRFLFGVKTHTF